MRPVYLIIGAIVLIALVIFSQTKQGEDLQVEFVSLLTREFRDNNPLGVEQSHTLALENITGYDDPLLVFATFQDGANAAAFELHDNYFARGYNTPNKIGMRWSGDTSGKYSAQLMSFMGLQDIDTVLDYEQDGVNLMKALCRAENGLAAASLVPFEVWTTAIQYGGLPDA